MSGFQYTVAPLSKKRLHPVYKTKVYRGANDPDDAAPLLVELDNEGFMLYPEHQDLTSKLDLHRPELPEIDIENEEGGDSSEDE